MRSVDWRERKALVSALAAKAADEANQPSRIPHGQSGPTTEGDSERTPVSGNWFGMLRHEGPVGELLTGRTVSR